MNLAACQHLTLSGLKRRIWYRAVQQHHLAVCLSTAHTSTVPGRFNGGTAANPAFEVLYLCDSRTVALFEVQALLGSPYQGAAFAPQPQQPWHVLQANVRLHSVVNLTVPVEYLLIGTTVQELTGDWQGYALRQPSAPLIAPSWSEVPTQQLGYELYNLPGVEGFVAYSAKDATHRNLVVFPQNLCTAAAAESRSPIQ
jgi:RES domain-containing protein